MIEAGLWRAIRIIDGQAKLLRALVEKMSAQGNSRSAVRFAARAVEAEESVAILRNVLLSSTVLDLSEDDLHDDEASDNARTRARSRWYDRTDAPNGYRRSPSSPRSGASVASSG
jgi:hypothetical protein